MARARVNFSFFFFVYFLFLAQNDTKENRPSRGGGGAVIWSNEARSKAKNRASNYNIA